MVNAMMHSMDQSGQLTPVAAIGGADHRYILMDGYLRIGKRGLSLYHYLVNSSWYNDRPARDDWTSRI